jgi:hypothetical protein
MKKVLIAILTIATMSFVIAGCGAKEEAAPAPATPPATTPATTG